MDDLKLDQRLVLLFDGLTSDNDDLASGLAVLKLRLPP
jgi:hypothetical protein